MSIASPSSATSNRAAMIEQAFRLEYMTLAWMLLEAAVAIGSGIGAGSLYAHGFRHRQPDRIGVSLRSCLALNG
jgi:hypothetical protein